MRRLAKASIPFLLIISLLIGVFAVNLIVQIRTYGTLINYAGIVRGATQRLVKLELSGQPNDEIRTYLNSIMEELTTGKGTYGLTYIDDITYRNHLTELSIRWEELKNSMDQVRKGASSAQLLDLSEEYFILANSTVFAADNYANRQVEEAQILIIVIAIIAVSTWVGIIVFNLKRLRRLEHDNRGLSHIAYVDKLTGAPNLVKFKLDAQSLLADNRSLDYALIYVDFDNFKIVNDVFGNAYGDRLLTKYSDLLRKDMGPFDTFCRVSADNFLVLRSYTQRAALIEQQQKLDQILADFTVSSVNEKHFIRTCFGLCCRRDMTEESNISELIERANYARKTAKNNVMQNYVFYNEKLRQKMLAEKSIENHMEAALENGEFLVYFQPKVLLATGKIACAEALTRWRTENGNMISPAEFIPIFERNLFIVKLDQFVLGQVCRWLRERLDAGLTVVPISVNVSRMQLYDPKFVNTYTQIKQKYQIPDGFLQVEFTESVVFEDMEQLTHIIGELKSYGFRCSLDDFGKGYSSLNLLKSLPVDELKLDGLFFEEDDDLERARIVVSSIVDLAKQLQLEIVAEGVEQEDQVAFLKGIGCDLVQGYVFYKPMPMDEFSALPDLAC